jgi:aspartate oxidase
LAAKAGVDPFLKKDFPVEEFDPTGPLFVAQITPVIHYTLGGIKVNLSLPQSSITFP